MSFGFNLCHYYLADLKWRYKKNSDVRESAPVNDRGVQSESRLNGGELLSQYDSVVGKAAGSSGTAWVMVCRQVVVGAIALSKTVNWFLVTHTAEQIAIVAKVNHGRLLQAGGVA
ncbi:MAG: hypothetical protein IPO31_23475 [Candidatus Obscuribacter sp.]|nr:hypothetical protein [Candidatus Obscuribacter sp.]